MTAPVDVLAVMDGTRAHLNSITCHPSYVERMDVARAAIAELIEHNKVMRAALVAWPCSCQDEDEDGDSITCDRCAALAHVGGGK